MSSPATPESRHKIPVRITHWINVLCFVAFVISGIGILRAHPRFYWGEVGYFDMPAAFELPLAVNKHHTSWGRWVHFTAAWIAILNGLAYLAWGFYSRHFKITFLPSRTQLAWQQIKAVLGEHLRFQKPTHAPSYNLLQKLAYISVVFILFPLIILTGLTMSPGFTSPFPQLFTIFGGRQSARTIHFFASNALLLFVAIHLLMITLAGFRKSILGMTTAPYATSVQEEK